MGGVVIAALHPDTRRRPKPPRRRSLLLKSKSKERLSRGGSKPRKVVSTLSSSRGGPIGPTSTGPRLFASRTLAGGPAARGWDFPSTVAHFPRRWSTRRSAVGPAALPAKTSPTHRRADVTAPARRPRPAVKTSPADQRRAAFQLAWRRMSEIARGGQIRSVRESSRPASPARRAHDASDLVSRQGGHRALTTIEEDCTTRSGGDSTPRSAATRRHQAHSRYAWLKRGRAPTRPPTQGRVRCRRSSTASSPCSGPSSRA